MRNKDGMFWFAAALIVAGAIVSAHFLRSASGRRQPDLFAPETVDLGIVEPGSQLEASFPVRNQSGRPVLLTHFTPSCGCMTLFRRIASGTVPLESATLQPDEELTVIVRFRPFGVRERKFAHPVAFQSDLPGYEVKSVLLTGALDLPLYPMPDSINWGVLRPEQAQTFTLQLYDLRQPQDQVPFKVRSDHSAVTVTEVVGPEAPGDFGGWPPGSRLYRINLRATAHEAGETWGVVQVHVSPNKILCQIPFYLNVRPLVRVIPSSVVLPRPGAPEPFLARVVCHSEAPCRFLIDSVPEGLQAEMNGSDVTIRCNANALPPEGTHAVLLTGITEDGQRHRLPIKVTIARLRQLTAGRPSN